MLATCERKFVRQAWGERADRVYVSTRPTSRGWRGWGRRSVTAKSVSVALHARPAMGRPRGGANGTKGIAHARLRFAVGGFFSRWPADEDGGDDAGVVLEDGQGAHHRGQDRGVHAARKHAMRTQP